MAVAGFEGSLLMDPLGFSAWYASDPAQADAYRVAFDIHDAPQSSAWDTVQLVLGGIGLIPVIGELADAVDLVISLARGDRAGAALSMMAMVPIFGMPAGAMKTGHRIVKHADEAIAIVQGGTKRAHKLATDAGGHVVRHADETSHLSKGKSLQGPGASGSGATTGGTGSAVNSTPSAVDPAATRPKLRKSTKEEAMAAAPKTPGGDYIDPNTGEVIPKEGPFDFGHPPGEEWWRLRDQARAEGWSRKDVIEAENGKRFQVEDPSTNRGHQYEQPK
jgi:hypothetical protein